MNLFGGNVPFAFIRPMWLLALAALPLLVWGFGRARARSGWERYIAPDKLRHLEIGSSVKRARRQTWIVVALALAIMALAGPSWRKLPIPVGQSRDAMIIAFDLSPSMLATDVSPDRLTRARLKLIDLLRRRQDGETALIAYAGGAHRVSPLTDDSKTIEVLVPSLHPGVMPIAGSEVEAAIDTAAELLEGASLERATLVLITDGIETDAFDGIRERLGDRLDLCLFVVGSDESVPIPLPRGDFLRDRNGQIRLTRFDRDELRDFANEQDGCFAELRSDDADVERILDFAASREDPNLEESERTFDVRQDEGFWIALVLLPMALTLFRKNVLWLAGLVLLTPIVTPSRAVAIEWTDLWQRSDQQTEKKINEGIERYREGRYEEAAGLFEGDSSVGQYNLGNALALEGRLEEAMASYDAALEADPENEDAAFNREVLEELLQEEQQQDSQSGDGDGEESPESDESESENTNESPDTPPSSSDPKPSDADEPPPDGSDESESSDPQASDGEETEEQSPGQGENEDDEKEGDSAEAQDSTETPKPLSDQSEQWLRNIPDDPGGLLRRKFQYEAELRRRSGQRSAPHERY